VGSRSVSKKKGKVQPRYAWAKVESVHTITNCQCPTVLVCFIFVHSDLYPSCIIIIEVSDVERVGCINLTSWGDQGGLNLEGMTK